MPAEDVLAQLEAMGTEQNRKIYTRHGIAGPMFGVSYANLGALKKKLKVDQALAEALWASGVHDARVLAAMVADPRSIAESTLDVWAADLGNHLIADAFAKLAVQTPFARRKAEAWIQDPVEATASAGWTVLGQLVADTSIPDDVFVEHLRTIEATIHGERNRVKYAMNGAVIAIGLRPSLRDQALIAARRIGPVEVDHGETDCKTPDAAAYILKTVEHRSRSAAKTAAKSKAASKTKSKSKT